MVIKVDGMNTGKYKLFKEAVFSIADFSSHIFLYNVKGLESVRSHCACLFEISGNSFWKN